MTLCLDDTEQIKDYLLSFDIYAGAPQEARDYITEALRRFIITVRMTPDAVGPSDQLLELGASPYYLTLLLLDQRKYKLHLANFFGDAFASQGQQIVRSAASKQTFEFAFRNFNVEKDPFPYPDASFRTVLCCEIIEHLTVDPTQMLAEIHRVLKPGGQLVLTTPNVLSLTYLVELAKGRNFFHPYSGYGVYGRHQREYTLNELTDLISGCGYEIVIARTEDLHPATSWRKLWKTLRPHRRDHNFILARRLEKQRYYYPSWLYNSVHAIDRVVASDVQMGLNEVGHMGLGWWQLELSTPPLRWTEKEARIVLKMPPEASSIEAEVCSGPAALGAIDVTLAVTGLTTSQTVSLAPDEWFTVILELPEDHGIRGRVEVVLTTSVCRSPAELGVGQDTRSLGVMVRRVAVR